MNPGDGGVRDNARRLGAFGLAQRAVSYNPRLQADDPDSWIEVSSQPSSSSLSSIADDIVTTGLRVEQISNNRRKRRLRHGTVTQPTTANRAPSIGANSSQEEYEESESESDRVMTSSNEGLTLGNNLERGKTHLVGQILSEESNDEDDENRTAINYPINNDHCFTPQPNAFSQPRSSQQARHSSQTVPGSYFPVQAERPTTHSSNRHSYPSRSEGRTPHTPYNVMAPSYNPAADHDAALRASLSTLLSCAAAARGLPRQNKGESNVTAQAGSNRAQPTTLRMVPESALRSAPAAPLFVEPPFKPTIRRTSTSTSASVDSRPVDGNKMDSKRKAPGLSGRSSSKDRRATKKARRSSTSSANDELFVTPTLLTWVVSAGVVVVLSALSFTAGYAMGKEAGRMEATMSGTLDGATSASEATHTGLGLRKLRFSSVARSVGVGA